MREVRRSDRRAEIRGHTRRDVGRLRRRGEGGSFWRSLALVGSVGWPIVLLATGGALAGRALDARLGTGIRFTLLFLLLGTALGCVVAWRAIRGRGA